MKKNFFRKVAFGIAPDETVPDNPVSWAQNQVDKMPPLIWDTKIRSGEEMLNHYAEWVYTCLLYTSPSPRDGLLSRMPSSA